MVEIAYTLTEAFAHLPMDKGAHTPTTFATFLQRALQGGVSLSVQLGGDVLAVPAEVDLSSLEKWGESGLNPIKLKRGQIVKLPLPIQGRALAMLHRVCNDAGVMVQLADDAAQDRKAYVQIDSAQYQLVSPELYTPKVMSNLENAALIARANRAPTGRYLDADFPAKTELVMAQAAVSQGLKSVGEIRALHKLHLESLGKSNATKLTADLFGVSDRQIRDDVKNYKNAGSTVVATNKKKRY